jgi:EpsG family
MTANPSTMAYWVSILKPKNILKYAGFFILTIIACILYFRFPFLVILASFTTLTLLLKNTAAAKIITILTITTILCWINSGKQLSGDLTWYYDHYILLKKLPLTSYLGSRVNQFTIKINEPFYYTISFILSRLTDGNTLILNIFITGWIYSITGIAFSKIINPTELSPAKTIAVLVAAMFTGVTFSLTTHLVRQEFATAALLLCATALHQKNNKLAIIFGLISIASHESTYIPFSCLLVGYFYQKSKLSNGTWNTPVKILLICLFAGAGIYYSTNISIDNPLQKIRSDGDVSPTVLALDATLYLIVALHAMHSGNKPVKQVLFLAALYFSFLIGISTSPLAFLRMYFYVDILRGCAVVYIAITLLKSRHGELFIVPIILVSTMYLELRIATSNFAYYGGGLISHLLFPIFFI